MLRANRYFLPDSEDTIQQLTTSLRQRQTLSHGKNRRVFVPFFRFTLDSDAGAKPVRASGARREAGKEEMKYTVPEK
jgi:hypothetical protein